MLSEQLTKKLVSMENESKTKTHFLLLLFHLIVYISLNQIGALGPMKRQQQFNLNHFREKNEDKNLNAQHDQEMISELNQTHFFILFFSSSIVIVALAPI